MQGSVDTKLLSFYHFLKETGYTQTAQWTVLDSNLINENPQCTGLSEYKATDIKTQNDPIFQSLKAKFGADFLLLTKEGKGRVAKNKQMFNDLKTKCVKL